MTKSWSSGNSYLRLLSSLSKERKKVMIYCTPSEVERQSVLQAVKLFEGLMSSGVVQPEVILKVVQKDGTIEVSVDDSREMS